MGTASFPGVKSGRSVTLTLHLLLVPWLRKSRTIPLLPLWSVRSVQSLSACTRLHFAFYKQVKQYVKSVQQIFTHCKFQGLTLPDLSLTTTSEIRVGFVIWSLLILITSFKDLVATDCTCLYHDWWKSVNYFETLLLKGLFFPVALRHNAGHGLPILEVSRSHTATHHSR